jgi:hypothetical protein
MLRALFDFLKFPVFAHSYLLQVTANQNIHSHARTHTHLCHFNMFLSFLTQTLLSYGSVGITIILWTSNLACTFRLSVPSCFVYRPAFSQTITQFTVFITASYEMPVRNSTLTILTHTYEVFILSHENVHVWATSAVRYYNPKFITVNTKRRNFISTVQTSSGGRPWKQAEIRLWYTHIVRHSRLKTWLAALTHGFRHRNLLLFRGISWIRR